MLQFMYWPYDEVTIEASADRKTILVKSPWLEAKLEGPLEPKENFEALLQKFQNQSLTGNDVGLLQWFFGNFEKYPLCYILPLPKEKATDTHTLQDKNLVNGTLETILSIALPNEKHTALEILKKLPRQGFTWDIDAVLSFSKQEENVHPESALTVARRYHLLELLENDKGNEVFQLIENLPRNLFPEFASLIVKQNLYVTEKCQEALTPALNIAQSARPTIEHFIQAERGHDRISGAAMKSLVSDPKTVPVSSQTVALMNLLQFAAKRNFLAFALAVDFFERNSYEKMDPLARLLLKGGFSEAAKQINLHMEINDSGGHENMGLQFLSAMKPCDPDYVREAFKIAEAISIVMNSVTCSALQLASK